VVGKRKLDQDAVDCRVFVQLVNQGLQGFLRGVFRKVIGQGENSCLVAGFPLVAYIYMRCGIVPDQHYGQSWSAKSLLPAGFNAGGDLLSYFGGNFFSIDQFGGHVSSCRLGIGKLEARHCLMLRSELQSGAWLAGFKGTFQSAFCH